MQLVMLTHEKSVKVQFEITKKQLKTLESINILNSSSF